MVFTLIFLSALELGAYVLAIFKILPINDTPIAYVNAGTSTGLDWRNENSEWGRGIKLMRQTIKLTVA